MSVNIASVPPPAAVLAHSEQRFPEIPLPCESAEYYRPGGYHPVLLGDVFNNGQYKVIRKIADSSFSTVWLARDLRNEGYVALKVLVSEIPSSAYQLQILRRLAKDAPEESSRHVSQLLNEFEHAGPNGTHKCLVFEPMAPGFIDPDDDPYPPPKAKRILKQIIEALDFLHSRGIAHGDLQPYSILFRPRDINAEPEEALRQTGDEEVPWYGGTSICAVQRLDGKHDPWAPEYVCAAQYLAPLDRDIEDIRIELTGIGGAYLLSDPPPHLTTPLGLRAPEVILNGTIDKRSVDIWSFGCLVFEFVVGYSLFNGLEEPRANDDHMLQLYDKLGALPEKLMQAWETSNRYFTPDGKLFNGQVESDTEDVSEDEWEVLRKGYHGFDMSGPLPIETLFDHANPEMDAEEASKLKALIRRILRYDPSERPSAAEIAADPWFDER